MTALGEIQPILLCAKDVQEQLGVTPAQLQRLVRDGVLREKRIGGMRIVRYHCDEVKALAQLLDDPSFRFPTPVPKEARPKKTGKPMTWRDTERD